MNNLKISPELALPISAVTQTFAFLGKRGGGKTYGSMKLAEQMLLQGAQICALDPVGVWYGLRVPKNKNFKGFDVVVFGGLYGDIPINPKAGRVVAEAINERKISAVVDVSQFVSAEQSRFAFDFLTTLFERQKRNRSPIHIFIEEAQEFVPQNVVKGDSFGAKMLNAGERVVKIGRNFGIGCSLISQRPQEINKKVLNQSEVIFAFQMTGIQERESIAKTIADKGGRQELVDSLPSLKIGEAYCWSPQWLEFEGLVHISEKQSADVSKTPEVGLEETESAKLSPVETEELRGLIAELEETEDAANPRNLNKQISDLKRKLIDAEMALESAKKSETKFPTEHLEELRKFIADTETKLKEMFDDFRTEIDDRATTMLDLVNTLLLFLPKEPAKSVSVVAVPEKALKPSQTFTKSPQTETNGAGSNLPQGMKKILYAIAQLSNGATRKQITLLTQYKASTRNEYLRNLESRGFIEKSADRFILTQKGYDALGDDYEPLPSGKALREHWLNNLPQGEAAILSHVFAAYPKSISRDALSELTSYAASTRNEYLRKLSTRELIEPNGSDVRASAELF